MCVISKERGWLNLNWLFLCSVNELQSPSQTKDMSSAGLSLSTCIQELYLSTVKYSFEVLVLYLSIPMYSTLFFNSTTFQREVLLFVLHCILSEN